MKHADAYKINVAYKLCSSGNELAVLNPKSRIIMFTLLERDSCGCLHLRRRCLEEELQRDGLFDEKSVTGALGKAMGEWLEYWWGWDESLGKDRPKGSPRSSEGGWVLLRGVCGCWAWQLHEELWVCSPAKQELEQVCGMLLRLPKPELALVAVPPGAAQCPQLGWAAAVSAG